MIFLKRGLRRIGKMLVAYTRERPPKNREAALNAWFDAKGDQTLRLNYDLSEKSVVFDLGGYEGQWTSDIYCKYGCQVHIFEPSKKFFEFILNRFSANRDITAYQFGLSVNDSTEKLYMQKDGSSVHTGSQGGEFELIELREANRFLRQTSIGAIDLIKINIEGGEYDLITHLIETGWVSKIKNIQVQFHDFVPNAIEKMAALQAELSKTHQLTYQYNFVWENWSRKD